MRPEETVTSAAEAATRESRREALKRFGLYAAVAPTAMVLLEPREGHAAGKTKGKTGKTKGKKGGGGGGY